MHIEVEVPGVGTVRVRPLVPADAESLARNADNPKIGVNLRDGFPSPYGVEHAEGFIASLPEDATVFAIEVGGEAAGCIGFTFGANVHRFTAEVGYWLGETHWGKGIASAVLAAATDSLFETRDLHRVFADPFAWNPASARVLEKAGFVLEGVKRCAAFKEGQVVDQLLFAKTRRPSC